MRIHSWLNPWRSAKPGTRLEPSNDEWFASLDASTRPIIMAPPQPQGGFGGYGGGYDEDYDYVNSGSCCGGTRLASFGADEPPPVQVVDQAVVGPYETITVRSTDPDALRDWLVDHGYAIPEISEPMDNALACEPTRRSPRV